MSNLSSANKNYRYLLVCVDVFSRLAFVVPMKNKTSNTIVESFREVLDLVEPTIINCDNGSEFINQSFKDLLIKRGITVNYVNVQDHHKLGIVDRFVRTLREKINKYMAMHNTTKYIDVLPKIVNNYNNSYHSGIKKKPIEVTDDDEKVIELTRKKYKRAKQEEAKFNVVSLFYIFYFHEDLVHIKVFLLNILHSYNIQTYMVLFDFDQLFLFLSCSGLGLCGFAQPNSSLHFFLALSSFPLHF